MSAEAVFLAQDLKRWTGRCACWLSEWRHWLVEAGLALCGPQHCRVMNDLTAGEVSSVLQIHADKKWFASIYDLLVKLTIWHFSNTVIVTKKRQISYADIPVCLTESRDTRRKRSSELERRHVGRQWEKDGFGRLIAGPMKLWPFEKNKIKIIK